MGGRASEVTDATTDIVLEVATFDAQRVRTTRRRAGLSTDASYRYERGIDDAMVAQSLQVGAALIALVSGGHVDALLDVGRPPAPRTPVMLRITRVARILGEAVPREECASLLASIGFDVVVDGELLKVTPPSWRHDVSRDVDLIEEIARLRGFDRLPDALTGARPGNVPDHPLWTAYRRVRDILVAAGLHEVRPLPFTSGRGPANDTVNLVRVQNPLAEDEPFLRSTILDTLAARAEYNLNRMQGNVRMFEVGSVFVARPGGSPLEEVRAALLVMGQRRPSHFTEPQPPAFDAWDAKSLAATLAEAAFQGASVTLEPGDEHALWYIMAGAARIGRVMRVRLDAPVWASEAFGVELTLGEMPNAAVAPMKQHAHGTEKRLSMVVPGGETPSQPSGPKRFKPIPTFPAAEFDLALLVPESLAAGDVQQVLMSAGGEMLERCVLFDEFRGAGVPEGMRSLAWRLTFRHPERTLRDKELEGRRAQLLKSLEGALGVRPRTG
jgi:phenylalanyl-tRNA synthetase beta chain